MKLLLTVATLSVALALVTPAHARVRITVGPSGDIPILYVPVINNSGDYIVGGSNNFNLMPPYHTDVPNAPTFFTNPGAPNTTSLVPVNYDVTSSSFGNLDLVPGEYPFSLYSFAYGATTPDYVYTDPALVVDVEGRPLCSPGQNCTETFYFPQTVTISANHQISVSAVPEPGARAMFGLAFLSLSALALRMQRRIKTTPRI